ncbi:MAG: beta strand repeat-containing protein [Limisphaerales bacterium]
MKIQTRKPAKTALLLVLLLVGTAPLQAQPNSWVNPGAGKWEVGANWFLGTPPSTNDWYDNIFSGTSVTIDATTSGSFPNTMTANTVALETPVKLELVNAGTTVPLHLLQDLDIAGEGNPEVIVTNSALQVDGVLYVGDIPSSVALFELDSGRAQIGSISLGNLANAYGTLYLNGGALMVLGTMTLATSPGGSGSVQMNGGALIHTNNPVVLGSQGFGGFNINGGSVQALGFQLGNAAGSWGSLGISGGTVLVSSNILVGNNLVTSPCQVLISSNYTHYGTFGTLIVTNAAGTAYIDVAQNGSLVLEGGVLQVDQLILTNGGTFYNLAGTFELVPPLNIDNGGSVVLAGSTNNFNSGVQLGSTTGGTGSLTLQSNSVMNVNSNLTLVSSSLTSTSTVTLSGGSLILTNGVMQVGPVGSGQLLLSGGSHILRQLWLGSSNNLGSGFFHMTGGSLKLLGTGTGPGQGLISNFVLWDGGDLDGSGTSVTIADGHDSTGTMTGGTGQYAAMYVGYSAGYTGTYAQSGGTMTISSTLTVGAPASGAQSNVRLGGGTLAAPNGNPADTSDAGDCSSGAVGVVTLSGGTLYVTNATHTAIFDVINGTVVLGAGATLIADNLIITNACGHFIKAGGTLTLYNPAQLDPNLDADGDGVSNGAEAAAGTDPLDPTSLFQITSLAITNASDLSVVWTTEGGHSYVVQTNGNLNNPSFNDLSGVIPVGGSGAGATNYVHHGAITHHTGFYRVRLGP